MKEVTPSRNAMTNDDDKTHHVMSVDEFKAALPRQLHGRVSSKIMDSINKALADQEVRDSFRDNLLGYTNVMSHGNYKLSNYIDGVKYISFKLMGYNNTESYARTFPIRYRKLVQAGADNKTLTSYANAYNRNKIVNDIWEQTLIPTWVLNADKFQQAINVQVDLMTNAKSEKVRADAANSLLNHLKPPETKKVQLDLGFKDTKSIDELKEITLKLAATQKRLIKDGITSAESVAETPLTIEHDKVEDIPLDEDDNTPEELVLDQVVEKKSIFEMCGVSHVG